MKKAIANPELEKKDPCAMGDLYWHLGGIYHADNKYIDAENALERALPSLKRCPERDLYKLSDALRQLVDMNASRQDFAKAITYARQAIEARERLKGTVEENEDGQAIIAMYNAKIIEWSEAMRQKSRK